MEVQRLEAWTCLQRIQGWDGVIAAVVDGCRQWRMFRKLMSIRAPFALGMLFLCVQRLAVSSCRLVDASHPRKSLQATRVGLQDSKR